MFNRFLLSTALVAGLAGLTACGDSPTTPTDTVTTITDTFSSRIQEKGSASRSFEVTTAGSVKVQLTAVSEAAIVRLGLGTMSGATCVITDSVDTAASGTADTPQITKTLGVGTYCTKITDIGNLTTIVDFTIVVTKPY